jgi:hypothetical protein
MTTLAASFALTPPLHHDTGMQSYASLRRLGMSHMLALTVPSEAACQGLMQAEKGKAAVLFAAVSTCALPACSNASLCCRLAPAALV